MKELLINPLFACLIVIFCFACGGFMASLRNKMGKKASAFFAVLVIILAAACTKPAPVTPEQKPPVVTNTFKQKINKIWNIIYKANLNSNDELKKVKGQEKILASGTVIPYNFEVTSFNENDSTAVGKYTNEKTGTSSSAKLKLNKDGNITKAVDNGTELTYKFIVNNGDTTGVETSNGGKAIVDGNVTHTFVDNKAYSDISGVETTLKDGTIRQSKSTLITAITQEVNPKTLAFTLFEETLELAKKVK